MTVRPVQLNMDNPNINPSFKEQKEYKSYLEAEGAVKTDDKVKPLPPKGHLVDDNVLTGMKYFFKDIGYDMKSVKDGYKGTANDHQLGRLNDVGLRLGGIGIAAYLASRTSDPKTRIMEYVGLGVFLAAMSIYPKLAINAPAKIVHGYDIDKEYIDDQGRKKSVQQDSNYVPYDMYLGARKDEDIDAIGDRMGIPRDIKNRHDVIKEQMRKIATQNNTLWMLTAGLATPLMTGLACYGIENYVVAPSVEKVKNSKADKRITEVFKKMEEQFSGTVKAASENDLSRKIEKIIVNYKNQTLPQEEFDNIAKYLTEGLPDNLATTIKEELKQLLSPERATETQQIVDKLMKEIESYEAYKNKIEISLSEMDNLINETLEKGAKDSKEFHTNFRKALKKFLKEKCNASSMDDVTKADFINSISHFVKDAQISGDIKSKKTVNITDEAIAKLVDLSKILGEFKENKKLLDSCEHFKMEFAPETVLARTSAKFEKTFLKALGINYKELKRIKNDSAFAKKILDERLSVISKDEAKFKKVMDMLISVVSEMETNLNGANEAEPLLKKLLNGYEYVYNGTAKRLDQLGGFGDTVKHLIGEPNAQNAKLTINSAEDLFKYLDGMFDKPANNVAEFAKGIGSDKMNDMSRILERYQDSMNGFNRVLHTLDTYRKLFTSKEFINALSSKNPDYVKLVIEQCKETLLMAKAGDHYQKLHGEDSKKYFDVINSTFGTTADHTKGVVTETTQSVLGNNTKATKWNVLERLKDYIARFRNIFGNDKTDFTKPNHVFNDGMEKMYGRSANTPGAKSGLVGQNLVDFMQGAAGRQYNTQKWVRMMSIALGSVLGVTLLAQFAFGKIRNPHNLQKQVNNDSN